MRPGRWRGAASTCSPTATSTRASGRLASREGRGIHRFASGAVYEGEYKAGEKEGQGTYLYASGDIEVGFYMADTRVGEGVLWEADGRSAIQMEDGKEEKTISLEEAERLVERLGLPMPVRREGKWTAGQPATAGWFELLVRRSLRSS